jgi:hypothetical protein
MRADRMNMVMAFSDPKLFNRCMTQRLRLLDLLGIEIEMSMEIADHEP